MTQPYITTTRMHVPASCAPGDIVHVQDLRSFVAVTIGARTWNACRIELTLADPEYVETLAAVLARGAETIRRDRRHGAPEVEFR